MTSAGSFRAATRTSGWAPFAVFVLHEVAASAVGHEPLVDPAMHFLGGVAITFFLRDVASREPRLGAPSSTGRDVIALGMALWVAVFWELGEVLPDVLRGNLPRFSAGNTLRDLALGCLGSLTFVLARRSFGQASAGSFPRGLGR